MAKTTKVAEEVKKSIEISDTVGSVLLESAFKAFDFYLQRQGKGRDEIPAIIEALKADAKNIANEGQKKFKVILEG